MERDRAEVGELVATIFDRLDAEFGGRAKVLDAVLLVEVTDEEDTVVLDDSTEREVPATIIMLESTTDRTTIHEGIIHFALRVMSQLEEEDEDD